MSPVESGHKILYGCSGMIFLENDSVTAHRMIPRIVLLLVGLNTLMCGVARRLPAQERAIGAVGSPYLSLDHWSYAYINVLLARGHLPTLSPMVQPYRRVAIAAAVRRAMDLGHLNPDETEWAVAIMRDLEYERAVTSDPGRQDLRLRSRVGAGAKWVTQLHRDVLRPEGRGEVFALLNLELAVDAPFLASSFRMRWDNHLLNDPQFPDGRAIEFRECDPIIARCGYRVDEGYVEIQMPFVKLFLGRLARNWGLPGTHGLLVSDYPYTYDHFGYSLGNDRISLHGILSILKDFPADTTRFFSSHRLEWRILDNLFLGLGESVIYGGPDKVLELGLINPVGIWEISGSSETGGRNTMGTAEIWWRPFSGVILYGGFLVDNTMVGEEGNKEGLTQWAASSGVQLPELASSFALRTDISLVNSLAYRSRIGPVEYYAFEGIGLAQDKADAIVLSVRGDWFASPRLALQPQIHVQWKGEDALTAVWPDTAFSSHPDILVGQVEQTVRPSIAGRWRLGQVDIEWDWGVNLISNEEHVPAASGANVEGRFQAVIRTAILR